MNRISTEARVPVARPLYCLAGGEAPAGLAGDLLRLARLPPEAVQRLWQVLAPSLSETIPPELEGRLDQFCATFHLDEEDLARVIKACRFVLREAAQRDVPSSAVAADLDALCPGVPLVRQFVLAGFEPAKAQVRGEMLAAAVLEHGQLLVKVGWRRDAILATDKSAKLRAPVAVLTLHYRDGAESRRLTLHALPDVVRELRAACDEVLA